MWECVVGLIEKKVLNKLFMLDFFMNFVIFD